MKILHTADWHIGQFKGPVVDGVNLRSQDTVNCLNYMIKVAEEEKPDIVCVSGDVFHQEQIGPVRYSDEMIVATDTITKLAGVAKAVIVMRGTPNHDGGGQFRVLSKMLESMELWNWIQKRNSPNREKSWLRKKKLSESKRILSNPKEIRNLNCRKQRKIFSSLIKILRI